MHSIIHSEKTEWNCTTRGSLPHLSFLSSKVVQCVLYCCYCRCCPCCSFSSSPSLLLFLRFRRLFDKLNVYSFTYVRHFKWFLSSPRKKNEFTSLFAFLPFVSNQINEYMWNFFLDFSSRLFSRIVYKRSFFFHFDNQH